MSMTEYLSRWVKNELEKRGWSQRELARRASLNSAYLSHVLSNKQDPGEKFFQGVAKALGFTAASLKRLNEDGTPPTSAAEMSFEELAEIIGQLPEEDRSEILEYALYRLWKQRRGNVTSDGTDQSDAAQATE